MRRARPYLGTLVEIGITEDRGRADGHGKQAIEAAFAAIAGIETRLSFQQPDSELSRLNRRPGQWVAMSRHSLRVLRLAKGLGLRSDDRFNCTVGGRLVKKGALPRHVDHDFPGRGSSADIDIGNNAARLTRPVLLTLDGIAKGYAVDLAVHRLRHFGIKGGWVNAGGDLRVFGDARLTIRQRSHRGLYGSYTLENRALASSRLAAEPSAEFPALLITRQTTAAIRQPEIIFSVGAASAWRADALTKVAASLPRAACADTLAGLGGQLIEFEPPRVEPA